MNEPCFARSNDGFREQFERLMEYRQEAQEFFSFRLTAPRLFLIVLAKDRAISRDEPKKELLSMLDSTYYERVQRLRFGSVAYRRMYDLCQRDIFYRRMHGWRVYFRAHSQVINALQSALATIPSK